jgi:integrase
MPRPRKAIPSYRLHRQSGQAIVTLTDPAGTRRDVLLGKHGTPESRQEYARVIAEWEAAGQRLPQQADHLNDVSVNELLLAYYQHAEGYYQKNGEPTTQLDRVKRSLKPVKELYGRTLARDFGPLALKAVRDWMVKAGWVRRYVNACVGCVKRAFKWAVAEEMIPSSVYHGLQAVEGLKKGRSTAPESRTVLSVEENHVQATLPFLPGPVRAMIQLQLHSGMRPGEAVILRPGDIDRSNPDVWLYRPGSHKTEHHDIHRVVFLGPKAQQVLLPFLFAPALTDPAILELVAEVLKKRVVSPELERQLERQGIRWRESEAYCFQPVEAMAEFRAKQRSNRKSKVQPSQQDRRARKPKRKPGNHYVVTGSYGHAVTRGIKAANQERACERCKPLPADQRCAKCQADVIPSWHVNQLRHTFATIARKQFGLEASQVLLGHQYADVTQVYAERNHTLAAQVAAKIG